LRQTGYALYWQLSEMGGECKVVAPTQVPVKAVDRVKTDRRDALARHRWDKFLLRTGQRPAHGITPWPQPQV
jgi:transposase